MLYDKRWEVKTPVMRPEEPWRQFLLDAADRIERQGWCRWRTGPKEGPNCAMGALLHLADNSRTYALARDHLAQHIKPKSPRSSISIISAWNDKVWRTKRQVVQAMRAAAQMEA